MVLYLSNHRLCQAPFEPEEIVNKVLAVIILVSIGIIATWGYNSYLNANNAYPLLNPDKDSTVTEGVLREAAYTNGYWQLTLENKMNGQPNKDTLVVSTKYKKYEIGFCLGTVYTVYETYFKGDFYTYAMPSVNQTMPNYKFGVTIDKTLPAGYYSLYESEKEGWESISIVGTIGGKSIVTSTGNIVIFDDGQEHLVPIESKADYLWKMKAIVQ